MLRSISLPRRKGRRFICFLALTLFFLPTTPTVAASAKAGDCPKKIAVIDKSRLSKAYAEVLETVYAKLGCAVALVYLPARRGFAYFNSKMVDGELLRHKMAEKEYSRAFVRSSVPLFTIANTLWVHPDAQVRERFPIGYILGIIWQEEFVKNRKNVRALHSLSDAEKSFKNNELGGFLAADKTVDMMLATGTWTVKPIAKEVVTTIPLYHYLAVEHAPFMRRFSNFLESHHPFGAPPSPAK